MSPPEHDQIAFWQALAAALEQHGALPEALADARAKLPGGGIEEIAAALVEDVQAGRGLSEAMRRHEAVFPPGVVAVVQAGEGAGTLAAAAGRIAAALEADELDSLAPPDAEPKTPQDAGLLRYVDDLVREAARARASDIHFEPTEDGRGRVRVRIDGVLHETPPPPEAAYERTISRLKVMAGMDAAERRLPQDGRIVLAVDGEPLDLRISTLPAYYGERLVARILSRREVRLDLARVGLGEADLETVRRLCRLPNGIVVVTGPVGCGKTTLLYSMLMQMDRRQCCVLSIESPVEYTLEGVSQIQVDPSVGLTFARAMRQALRQDPDILLVGELRDLEGMNIAVQIAMTGHLLLTTRHAPTAVEAVRGLVDCGLEPFMVNSALSAVIAMRLARLLCDECKQPGPPDERSLSPEAVEVLSALPGATFYRPVGCDACRGTGYRGRTGLYEILEMDARIQRAVTRPADAGALRAAAREAGVKPMLVDGLEKAARGLTSVEEVCRIVPRDQDG